MAQELIKRKNFNSSELIDLLATHDTLIKKLTCDYLVDKSSIDSNLSLLTANILLRDCGDANPSIRSSSLLALSNLPGMEEAAISSVSKAMNDPSPHVRRVAPHCCCNIYKLSPEGCLGSGLVDMLYAGIRDSDPIVICNCLLALENILCYEGGLVINKNIAHHLYGKLNQFPDCSAVYVLNLLKKYEPKNQEEIFWILNHLDHCLNSTSPSVLLAAAQLFKSLIRDHQHLTSDLVETVKFPICKVLNQNRPEICYFLMKYLRNFSPEFSSSFHDQYKFFLIKTKDPFYIKEQKFEILPLIVSKHNVNSIISELKHYTSDFQSHRIAFKCLGILGTFNSDTEEEVINILTFVLKASNDQVAAAALHCLLYMFTHKSEISQDLTHIDPYKYPEALYSSVSIALSRSSITENHPETVMYLLQFVAPFLESIQDIMEELLKQMDTWELSTKLLFVTSSCISFLYSPSAVQPIFSSVLSRAFYAPEKELSSRAAFVYAALEEGPQRAFQILSCSKYFPHLNTSFKMLKPS